MGGNKTPIMDEALLRDPSAKTGSGNITADCGAEKSKVRPGLPVVFSGGVASNAMLREACAGTDAVFAQPQFSTDNAMGVAILTARLEGLDGAANS